VAAYTAILYARAHPKHFADTVRIMTDSVYVIGCARDWCNGWRRRGWRKPDGKPPEHLGIIKRMYRKLWKDGDDGIPKHRRHPRIEFVKVKGHAKIPGNERADRLAVLGTKRELDDG
jgi:ribonuclease HI